MFDESHEDTSLPANPLARRNRLDRRAPARFQLGVRLGPYQIEERVGVGGMGEVYRATDTRLKRRVAIKVLSADLATDEFRLARLQREAEVLASLNHPNIAAIYGTEDSGGLTALVMEFIEGDTLAERIARGRIPAAEAVGLAVQIADALEAAHEEGLVHRDLKPSNIKVKPDGAIKVLDFGLAKSRDAALSVVASLADDSDSTLTAPRGAIVGTPAYMSPEQARGGPVDRRADLWAFGCVLFEMLTGKRPFESSARQGTVTVRGSEPDYSLLPPDTPPGALQALRLCLQEDPRRRGGDIAAIRLVLEGAFPTINAPAIGSKPARLRRSMFLGGAVLAASLVAWWLSPTSASPRVNRFEIPFATAQKWRNAGWLPLSLSPDGSAIAYNTSDGLFVRNMGELEPVLVANSPEDLVNPIFSPDGRELAYVTHTGLKRVPLTGGSARTIAPAPAEAAVYGASWETDGTIYLAIPEGIARVPASGGRLEVVIPVGKGETFFGPTLLPDGKSVLFTVTTATGGDRWDHGRVVVQSLSDRSRTVVVTGGSDARYLSTGHLVYAVGNSLLGVPFDANTRTVKGAAVVLAAGVMRAVNGLTGSANYSVSRQGTLVYAKANTAVSSTLVWVDRRGREAAFSATDLRNAEYPRVAPDGKRVALIVNGDVWVYDIGGRPLVRLTFDGGNYSPMWTLDGQRLVFESTNPAGIRMVPADGSARASQSLLTFFERHFHAHGWTRTGDLIAVEYRDTPDVVRWTSGGTGEPVPIVQTNAREGADGAAMSPDGRLLAYASNQSGRQEIWVQPYADAGTPVQVSQSGGMEPVWARAGDRLFYLEGRRLMVVAVSKSGTAAFGTPQFLFQSPYLVLPQPPSYDVSPDGRFLMVKPDREVDATPHVVVVQNWFEAVRRLIPRD